MTSPSCASVALLIQADGDGELSAAEAARVAEHLGSCPECAELPERLAALSRTVRREATVHPAPDALRARIVGMVAPPAPPPRRTARSRWQLAAPFGAGLAVAAALMLALLPRGVERADELVAGHIRALQPGHLMDVASTDQHTVKPWFNGRLDFAPPVRELKAAGFPLEGGRLDVAAGRPVAVLIYGRRQHVIDLFIWPQPGQAGPTVTDRNGYNAVHWTAGGMTFWAVSDLNRAELEDFAERFRSGE